MSMTQRIGNPDPEFVARLENELTREHRRLARLGLIDEPRRALSKWLRNAAFALVGLSLGAASVTMAQRLEDAQTAELLLRIAAGRADLSRQIAVRTRLRSEQGVAPVTAMYPAQKELVEAELQVALAELDVEEIRAGGRPVRTDISAPLVGGRDFVSERLQLELDANSERTALLDPMIEFMDARVRAGINVPDSLRPLTVERDELAAVAMQIDETLTLRRSFLIGDIDAEEADLRYRLLIAATRRRIAETRLDDLRAASDILQPRVAAGVAPTSEATALEVEQQRAEAEVQMARMEVDLITAELGRR